MSNQITTAFVQQFSDNLIMLAQQKGSRIRDRVMNKTVTGDAAYFERIGAVAAVPKTTRHMDSPQMDTPHSRRRVTLTDYLWGDLIDAEDEVRMLIDPTSAYAQSGGFALGRAIDDVIIAAATGSATAVTSSLTAATSSVAFPAANVIAHASADLTVAKLISARRLLMKNNIDMSEEMTLVVNSSAIASLLGTTQVTSADYNTVKALVSGNIDTFMGFKFVQTERLLGVADGTSTAPIKVLAFAKSALGLAVGRDINIRISERADKNYATYVHAAMSIGATRIEEEKIVEIDCVQAA
jgi:hypothetical protein